MNEVDTLLKQIDYLLKHKVKYNSYEFLCFYNNMEAYLKKTYGKDSNEYKKFKSIKFASDLYVVEDEFTMYDCKACESGLLEAKKLLK